MEHNILLNDLIGAETKCKVSLLGGEALELTFRPFTLKDLAWMQQEFNTEDKRLALAGMAVEAVCKVVWQLLTAESKSQFKNITFTDYDEDQEKEITVDVRGYEKLMHSLSSQEDMIKLFVAYSENESINSFIPSYGKKDKKKV